MYQKSWWYDLQFLRYRVWQTENPENQKFEKKINCWRYHHFAHVYQKPQLYEVWFLRYRVKQTEFFVILGYFLPFYPANNLENQNFEKMRKPYGIVIILHLFTKSHNHLMYGSLDMERDRQNVFSFQTIFCSFSSLLTLKIKIWKKIKKHLEISSIYTCVPKVMIRWCMVPEIWCATDRQMDRQTDKWKKWHIEVRAPRKKMK